MEEEKNIQFSVKRNFGKRIDEIWNDEKFNEIPTKKQGYAIQDTIQSDALMFIGINPSYDGNHGNSYYDNHQEEAKVHKYFRKFQDISQKIEIPWTHFDLLFVRETQQSEIEKMYSNKNGLDFIVKQLEISKEVIELAKPRVIIVNNTLARKYLGFEKDKDKNENIWMDFDFEFDPKIGTHIITKGKLKNTPVFFTSMLTGQRALDNGSYERLIWHIKFVLEKNFC